MKARSKGRVVVFSVMLLALAFAGCQVFPSYAPFDVRVSVLDETGAAVQDARVSLRGPGMNKSATSAGNGVAILEDVEPGNYILAVTYPNGAGVSYSLPFWGSQDHDYVVELNNANDHLIAEWSFEEAGGDRVEDTSKNNHFGQIVGDVRRAPGISGQGVSFHGGHIMVKNSGNFNLDAFTVSLWANIDDPSKDQKLVGRTPIGSGFIVGLQNNGLRPELWAPNHRDFESGEIPAREWVHLVVTFQAGVGMTGYINGEQVGHVDIHTAMAPNTHDLIMGANSWGRDGHRFEGTLDEVKIYDRVLSVDEIKALAQKPAV